MPIMLVVSAFLWVLISDGELSCADGVIFTLGIIGYTFLTYYLSKKKDSKEIEAEFEIALTPSSKSVWLAIVFIVGGLAILILGANIFDERRLDGLEGSGHTCEEVKMWEINADALSFISIVNLNRSDSSFMNCHEF